MTEELKSIYEQSDSQMTPCTLPLVTYFIPSFNHAQYVERAVESVLNQDYRNLELIVVDDGSSDDSHEVLRQYESDPRVSLILNEVNRGQSTVFKQALAIAQGAFIGYLPSDDWHLPNKTKLQVEKFLSVSPKVGVVYGRGSRFYEETGLTKDDNQVLYRGNVLVPLLDRNFVFPASPMFRKECFEKVKLDESYSAEGESIYVKLALHYEFDYVDEVVSVMRDHEYNTGKDIERMYADNIRYWSDFFSSEDLPDDIRALKNIRLGYIHRMKGLEMIRILKRHRSGRKALLSAIQVQPKFLLDWKVLAGLAISFLPTWK